MDTPCAPHSPAAAHSSACRRGTYVLVSTGALDPGRQPPNTLRTTLTLSWYRPRQHTFVFSANSSNLVLSCDAQSKKASGCAPSGLHHTAAAARLLHAPASLTTVQGVCACARVSEPAAAHTAAGSRQSHMLGSDEGEIQTRHALSAAARGRAHQQPSTAAAQRQQQDTAAGGLLRCRNTLLLCWPDQAGTRPPVLQASTCRQRTLRPRREKEKIQTATAAAAAAGCCRFTCWRSGQRSGQLPPARC